MRESGLNPARVRVPCSTSNLGAGFDCIGLALDRYLDATFVPGGDDLVLERVGDLATLGAAPEQDLVTRAFRLWVEREGIAPRGVIRVESEIPVARGLGSSAAAVVAGLTLAGVALSKEWRVRRRRAFQTSDVIEEAVMMERHPDNVGPAVLGGLVAASPASPGDELSFTMARLPLSPEVGFAFAAPAIEVATPMARAALPDTVPFRVAAGSVIRVVALLRGLAQADEAAIRVGFADELHVPHRLPLIPRGREALDAACSAGAWAATISGSGSGLIAACPRGAQAAVSRAMGDALGAGAIAFPVHPAEHGALLLEPL